MSCHFCTFFFVESYEGEKNKGFFEGYGKAVFKGGHRYEVSNLCRTTCQ